MVRSTLSLCCRPERRAATSHTPRQPWALAFALIPMLAVASARPASAQQANAQTASPQAPSSDLLHRPASVSTPPPVITLTVPQGTPLEVALDREVRVQRVGQPIHGHTLEPVYAFDKLVIPAGSEITGEITRLGKISPGRRAAAVLDANFTPPRAVTVVFDQIVLPGGTRLPVRTLVTPGSGQVLDFAASARESLARKSISGGAARKIDQAKEQARQEWTASMRLVKTPGKLHRAERYGFDQLPIRLQFLDSGAIYFAELQTPLEFGSEPLTPEAARSIGELPPVGGVVHARLTAGLTSAANHQGDAVSAVITRPLWDGERLIVPQGSVLSGTVVRVKPARRWSRNGELHIVFRELRLPDGVEQKIEANLQSVQAEKSANLRLDPEGGAHATTPKTRYLSTAMALGLAGLSVRGDPDATTPNPAGNAANRMAGGAVGYKLVGIALGAFVHSRAFGYSMGAYGAGMSLYTHFVARGHDVVFPQDTAMLIGLGVRQPNPVPAPATSIPPGD